MRRNLTRTVGAAFAALTLVPPAMAQLADADAPIAAVTDPRDGYPDLSPDGRRIVFQSNRTGSWNLWVVNVDGSGLTRLTHGEVNDTTPVWSPDGNRILFASDRRGAEQVAAPAGSRDIFVIDVSGGLEGAEQRITPLVQDPADAMHPEWAEGGRTIVFNRVYDSGDGADVVIAGENGGNARSLGLPRAWNTYANLTPDGTRLVYRSTFQESREGEPFENSDIVSAAPDGSDRMRLTSGQAFDGWPAVSPDGRWIAYASGGLGSRYHIHLMPVGGGEPRQVTSGDRFNYTQPAWASDGGSLVAFRWVADDIGEVGHIVRIALDD